MGSTRVPLSTYRLQFHRGFTFRDAGAVVEYLHDLGISDCYASSYLKAVPGSGHGYDIADPTRLNPEISIDEGRFVRINYYFADAPTDPSKWSLRSS